MCNVHNYKLNEELMSNEVKLFEGNQQPRRKRRGIKPSDGKMRETDAAARQKLHQRVRMINLSLIIEKDGARHTSI